MRRLAPLVMLVALASAAFGQEERVRLSLRVSSTGPSVIIDRGTSDGVDVGDLVLLFLHEGGTVRAVIAQPNERSSTIELQGGVAQPPVGTRGEVLVPRERFEATEPDEPEDEPLGIIEVPEHPPWENDDEGYVEGQPLLAEIGTVRPEERATVRTGRVYLISDFFRTVNSERSDNFTRLGFDLRYQNPWDRGGELNIDAEVNNRAVTLDENDDDLFETNARIDRLSYVIGGNRFLEDRKAYGRFLSYGMPEFGVIDGFEFTRETKRGQLLGWSIGAMPEPDADYDTFNDFQVSAHYFWQLPDFPGFTLHSGYQKTFHNGDADRDLFIFKLRHELSENWDLRGTTWVDYYGSDSNVKDSGLELTQAIVTATRLWDSGDGVVLSYDWLRFPDIDRNEFLFVNADQIRGDRFWRAGADGWHYLDGGDRVSGGFSVWQDEDEAGTEFEASYDAQNFLLSRSLTSVLLFYNASRFADSFGVRGSLRRELDNGHWSLSGEAARNRQNGFSDNLDDLPRIRGRASRGLRTLSGWDIEVYTEGTTWDQDHSWAVGLFAQKVLR